MAAAFIHDAPLAPASTGKRNKAFGPMSKLFGSESAIIVGHDLTSLAAPQALFQNNPDLARLERAPIAHLKVQASGGNAVSPDFSVVGKAQAVEPMVDSYLYPNDGHCRA